MEKTGSLVDAIEVAFNLNFEWYKEREKSEEGERYSAVLVHTLDLLKESTKKPDLDVLICVEEMLLEREAETFGENDKTILPSLKAALTDFSVIKNSVEVAKIPENYQNAASTHHTKKKLRNGVVIDGCHEAMNSHITRLGNRMSTLGISTPEKDILRQRQANVRLVKELYIDLQKKALGIDSPAKEKGRGR